VVRILLKHGASVNAESIEGLSPIHEALASYSVPLLGLLCSRGPDLLIKFPSGITIIDFALDSPDNDSIGCMGVLLQHGAEIEGQGDSTPPLSRAVENLIKPSEDERSPSGSFSTIHLRNKLASKVSKRKSVLLATPNLNGNSSVMKCLTANSCEHLGRSCAKIRLPLCFKAENQVVQKKHGLVNGKSPAKALWDFTSRTLLRPHKKRGTKAGDFSPCDTDLIRPVFDMLDPSRLLFIRVALEKTPDFEWDDTISLLREAGRRPGNSISYTGGSLGAIAYRSSESTQVASDLHGLSQYYHRAASVGTVAVEKDLRKYDARRKALLFAFGESVPAMPENPSNRRLSSLPSEESKNTVNDSSEEVRLANKLMDGRKGAEGHEQGEKEQKKRKDKKYEGKRRERERQRRVTEYLQDERVDIRWEREAWDIIWQEFEFTEPTEGEKQVQRKQKRDDRVHRKSSIESIVKYLVEAEFKW